MSTDSKQKWVEDELLIVFWVLEEFDRFWSFAIGSLVVDLENKNHRFIVAYSFLNTSICSICGWRSKDFLFGSNEWSRFESESGVDSLLVYYIITLGYNHGWYINFFYINKKNNKC